MNRHSCGRLLGGLNKFRHLIVDRTILQLPLYDGLQLPQSAKEHKVKGLKDPSGMIPEGHGQDTVVKQ
jgi:hypothetical protein